MVNRTPFTEQILSIPTLIEEQYDDLFPKVHELINAQEIFEIKHIILTGCGDSYAACLSLKYIFQQLTQIPTSSLRTIDLSRSLSSNLLKKYQKNILIIYISNSGTTPRIIEALQRGKKYMCKTLSITSGSESEMASLSEKVIDLDIPPFVKSPGMRTYSSILVALLLLAIRIGEIKSNYTMKIAYDYRDDIKYHADLLNDYMPEIFQKSEKISNSFSTLSSLEFIGSENDLGAAYFNCAKSYESTGIVSTYTDSEEWFHVNFLAQNPQKIATFIICSNENPAHSRNIELINFALQLGRPLVIITNDKNINKNVDIINFPNSKFSFSSIFSSFIPASLIISFITEIIGEKYSRASSGRWEFAAGGKGIKNTEIIIN